MSSPSDNGATALGSVKIEKGLAEPLLAKSKQNGLSTSREEDHDGQVDKDTLQFMAATYFVTEGDKKCEVDIMRIGKAESEISVRWYTVDASAKAGVKFVAKDETITFRPGEKYKTVEVEVIDNELWEAVSEFAIQLAKPEASDMGNYVLSWYLSHCRVKIIDDDIFPSNKYREYVLKGEEGVEEIPGVPLMWSFIKFCFNVPGIWRKSLAIFIFDQMKNLYYLLKTYLVSIYMVDVLFKAHAGSDELWLDTPNATAQLVAALFAVPFVFLHIWDYQKAKMDVAGILRSYFQSNLFFKYLNYAEGTRAGIPHAEISRIIVFETAEVVEAGFMKFFAVIDTVVKLLIVVGFILSENPSALLVIIVFPVVMVGYLYWRNTSLVKGEEAIVDEEAKVMNECQVACEQYRLIADYSQRPRVADKFAHQVEAYNEAKLPVELMMINNLYVPEYLSTIFTFCYIIMFAPKVFEGELSIGTFIAMIKIFSEIGEEFAEAYEELMDISRCIGPLRKIVLYINGHSDLCDRKVVHEARRKETLKRIAEEQDDSIAVEIKGLEFGFQDVAHTAPKGAAEKVVAQSPQAGSWKMQISDVVIPQGSVVCVMGQHGTGKATVIKLLSGIFTPGRSHFIYIPTHLRMLHVSQDAVLLEAGLWANLTFGREAARPDRVIKVLRRVQGIKDTTSAEISKPSTLEQRLVEECGGVHPLATPRPDPTQIRESLKANEFKDARKWLFSLNYSDRAYVHLARALIMNPEILIINHPSKYFNEARAKVVMELLVEHTEQRGLEMGDVPKASRSKRTVIYSCDREEQAKMYATDILGVEYKQEANKSDVRMRKVKDMDTVNISSPEKERSGWFW